MRSMRFGILTILICSWLTAACVAQSERNLDWLTKEERQFLKDHPVVRVAPTPHFPPFEYWDLGDDHRTRDDDVFSGVVSSYLEHFEKELGIKFKMVRTDTWAQNLAKLKSREIDAVPLLVPWSDRDYVAVSKPYITYPAVIVVRKDGTPDLSLKDLAGQKVAVPNDYTGESFLRQVHPEIIVVEANDPAHGVRLVATGEVKAFFGGSAAVAYVAERAGITNVRIAGESDFQYTNGFGVRSDWKMLADIISKTLDRTPDGQKSAFHSQWITEGFLQKKFYETRRFWWFVGTTATLLLLGSIGMVIWNRRQAAFIEQLEAEKQRTEKARREAETANKAKSAFVAMISHEIRTPMNGVLGMCELMRSTDLDEKQLDYLESASGSAKSLVGLVNDILDVSKMEAGKLELDPRPFSLKSLVNEATTLMQTQADAKGLSLQVSMEKGLAGAYIGDPLRIRQILLNFLSNAIKFTQEGKVSVRIRKSVPDSSDSSHLVEFEIEDSGIGVAADKLERIFEPFEQEEISTSRRYGGTGLGLSICRNLAEMMGGTASATSIPGTGSTFRFSARLEPTDSLPETSVDNSSDGSSAPSRRRVLLAEDNPINQKVVEGLLELRGHEVEIVTSGQEALSAIERNGYDLVLMDIEMPGMDGLSAVSELRNRERPNGKRQFVVAMTGHAMLGDRERFLNAGMDEHLVKPFSAAELYAIVEGKPAMTLAPEPSSGDCSCSVIDREKALATTGGNEELADQLLETCLLKTPDVISNAKKAVSERDFVTAKRCGHSLTSSFGAIGACRASEAASVLEFMDSSDPEQFMKAIEGIEEAFDEIKFNCETD